MANSARVVLRSVDPGQGSGLVFEAHAGNGGSCGMDVIGILRKKRQQVTGYEVVVTGERRDEYPRRFTRIETLHRVRGRNLSPAAIEEAIRLSDTKYCTVYATLAPAVELVSRYEIIPEPA